MWNQLTKSALIVSLVFILTITPETVLYILFSLGVIHDDINSPLKKAMVFLTLLNSCANPVVYLFVLPAYRRGVIKLFCRGRKETPMNQNLNSTDTTYI